VNRSLTPIWVGALCTATLCVSVAEASVLDRVLELIDAAYPDLMALSFSANIAENVSNPMMQNKSLSTGDLVIIGYDPAGTAVFGTADQFGVLVTPSQAAALGSGLSAGLYPIGSAVYTLPPAGQLSIYDQSASGASLALAAETVMSRIDGSISNTAVAFLPDLTTDVAAVAANLALRNVDFASMGSTALGAVNTGEIITHVKVVTGPDALAVHGIDLARLGRGPNATMDYAMTDDLVALSSRVHQMGGGLNESILALNLASNSSAVSGRVQNTISGLNARIGDIVTTAIGAVNGGSISN
jgi:hypothetical protein